MDCVNIMAYSIVMDSQWLNRQFELYPTKTKARLADVLGLEPPAVSKILKGMRQIKAKEYALMRQYFGLSLEDDTVVNRVTLSDSLAQSIKLGAKLQEDIFDVAQKQQSDPDDLLNHAINTQHKQMYILKDK